MFENHDVNVPQNWGIIKICILVWKQQSFDKRSKERKKTYKKRILLERGKPTCNLSRIY
jgi:hypothetical protein